MSVLIDIAPSPVFDSFADYQPVLSPSSALKSIALEDAVQQVSADVNEDSEDSSKLDRIEDLSKRLEKSINEANTALATLKEKNASDAEASRTKRDLRDFALLYTRIIRKEIRLYKAQSDRAAIEPSEERPSEERFAQVCFIIYLPLQQLK